jgi:hypothetical protein
MKIPRVVLGTAGKCIYCGRESEPLRTEHIVPYGLNGPWELLKATCDDCAAITSAVEKSVLKDSLIVLRSALKLPTRRKKHRPISFPLTITRDGKEQTVKVPVHDHLAVMILTISPPPAHLDGRPYGKGVLVTGTVAIQVGGPPLEELAKIYGAKTFSVTATWHGNCFERMLAKIAYGFAVAHFGSRNLEEVYVIPAILGKKDDVGRWVGCANDITLEVGKYFHQIDLSVVNREIIVRVKLFAIFNVPEYLVVVGRLSKDAQQ